MSSPLISVVLCTYNGEKYIDEQLQSIQNQTHNHLEIIVVDDCSTDNTFTIITSYTGKDNRISCFRNDTNLGFNKNFEKAIQLTSGNFIAISDQDDIWNEHKLELLLNNIGDNWLIFSNSTCINEHGKSLNKEILQGFFFEHRTYKSILLNNWVTGHTTLFKQEFLKYILPFPVEGFYDWWIGFVAIYHHQITYFNKSLTYYRIHSDSVMQQDDWIEQILVKRSLYNTTLKMLNAFANYNHLTKLDKSFLLKLEGTMLLKKKRVFSILLMKIIYKNYEDFFPDQERKGLSKLNFAYKFAKQL